MKKKFFLLAPVFFAVGFILNLYLGNVTELDLPILVTPIVAGAITALAITVILALVFRKATKGAVLGTVVVVALFTLGTAPWVALVAILVAGAWIFRTKRSLVSVSKYLFVISSIFVVIALGRVFMEEQQKFNLQAKSPLKLSSATKKDNMPDIYYIVPDSYSASKSLLKYYGYDNSKFEKSLTDLGFYVATESASNYPKTFLSLGSSLNMEYLDYLSKNKASKNLSLIDPLIENNNVVKFLKGIGYDYYHLGSWWGATHTNKNATQNVILENERGLPISQFDYVVLESTALEPLIDKFLPKVTVGDSDKDRMERAEYQFEQVAALASAPSPKFVFMHLIAPHEPYFYGRDCEFVTLSERKKIKEEIKYTNHLTCVNEKLLMAVSGILANSKKPPIIIIQSDEGAPFLAEELSPPDSWGKASDDLLREKFFVFNSYYLPGTKNEGLYPEITPVNSFRFIFNKYFGTNFPILPDRSYILPDLKHLYDFVDVTDTVRKPGV